MSKKNKIDVCRVCGGKKVMSFEHIPPESAFNKGRVNLYQGTDVLAREQLPWHLAGVKHYQSQRGSGFETVCQNCNSFAGHKYVKAYKFFVHVGIQKLYHRLNGYTGTSNFINIRPLNIIKQIIMMFLAINPSSVGDKNYDLRSFVLNPEKKDFNTEKYGIYIYFLKGNISKFIGISGVLRGHRSTVLSELAYFPYGFILEINPPVGYKEIYNVCNLAELANLYSYNEVADINLKIPILETHTIFPLDYRTKNEIISNRIEQNVRELLKKKFNEANQ